MAYLISLYASEIISKLEEPVKYLSASDETCAQ